MADRKEYECSNGHWFSTRGYERDHNRCLACVDGKPCEGTVRRVGPGSRKAKAGV